MARQAEITNPDNQKCAEFSNYLDGILQRYDLRMNTKLATDLIAALHANGDHELEVVDPETHRSYLVVDADVHRKAMDALRRQQDGEATAGGIEEMEAGAGIPLEDARRQTRQRLQARRQ